ncbi:hypothetical protein TMM008_55190 [Pseudomonas sp. 008]|nr:hypothetical protein TMM008_55190 [Pseudomonas sp. 008]
MMARAGLKGATAIMRRRIAGSSNSSSAFEYAFAGKSDREEAFCITQNPTDSPPDQRLEDLYASD